MRPLFAWIVSLLVAAGFLFGARSTNLFVEQNAYRLYALFVATFVAPCMIAFVWTNRPWRWAIPIPLGVIVGDLFAIQRDLAKDSTSHNMWPMEVALLLVVCAVCALAGAFTGAHVSRKRAGTLPAPRVANR